MLAITDSLKCPESNAFYYNSHYAIRDFFGIVDAICVGIDRFEVFPE